MLENLPSDWAFEDKILVFLLPSFKTDVLSFYKAKGKSMAQMFKEHHLQHIDRDLAPQLSDVLDLITLENLLESRKRNTAKK